MAKSKSRRARPQSETSEYSPRKTTSKREAELAAAEAAKAREAAFESRFSRVFPFLAAALLLFAAALLFAQLGRAPYSHDEGIHAMYGFNLKDYNYDPVYHGPLLYHLVALIFHFFGDSNATGRLVPALMGFGVVALTLFSGERNAPQNAGETSPQNEKEVETESENVAASTREDTQHIFAPNAFASSAFATWDKRAALCAAALLLLSPVFVAYSRHLIHDSLVMFLTLGAVLCFAASFDAPAHTRRGIVSRLGLAVFLALFICTKANSFFIIAMLLSAWLAFTLSPRVLARCTAISARAWPAFVPLGAFVAVAIASIYAPRTVPAAITEVLLRESAIAMQERVLKIVCVAATLLVWEWMRRGAAAKAKVAARKEIATPEVRFFGARVLAWCVVPVFMLYLALSIYAFFYGHGYLWLEKLRAGENIFALYGKDLWGRESAMPRMIDYWSGQQGKPRLAGRHDYYIVLLAIYELPILLAALCGVVRAAKHRTPFTDVLLWWSFTSFALYSLANEKVPWLMAHIVLPMALLGGWFLSQKWREIALRENLRNASTRDLSRFRLLAAACAIFGLRGVVATSFGRPVDHREPLYYAKSSESFGGAFLGGMRATSSSEGSIWVHPDAAWPSVWYLRKGAPYVGKSPVDWAAVIAMPNPRLALTRPEKWWKEQYEAKKIARQQLDSVQFRLKGWKRQTVKFNNWPRASWGALRPDRYVNFWLHRAVDFEYDAQTQTAEGFLSEWSFVEFDVCTPPENAALQQ